jgi:hypothetical protein
MKQAEWHSCPVGARRIRVNDVLCSAANRRHRQFPFGEEAEDAYLTAPSIFLTRCFFISTLSGGGKDRVESFIERAKDDVIMARDSLVKAITIIESGSS